MKSVEVKNLKKVYETNRGKNQYLALRDVSFTVDRGDYVAIMGESGSGKTTLLNILAGLDNSTSGSVFINGKEISKMEDSELAKYRSQSLGFIFQDFNLLDILTVRYNIYLPLVLNKQKKAIMKEKTAGLVKKLGIEGLVDKYPYEISGGQKQRTAIARAMVIEPEILLADEPTGALDSKAANNILDLFGMLNEEGQTILMVTHSIKAASRAKRVLFIKDGELNHEIKRRNGMSDTEMNAEIISHMAETEMIG